jgi:ankyrin repeat protein
LSVVKALIAEDANSDLINQQGDTLLHFATRSGDIDTLSWLLENTHIDVNATNQLHETPLNLCDQGEPKEAIKALLIEHGARQNGSTPGF